MNTVECPIYRFAFNISKGLLYYKRDQQTKRVLLTELISNRETLKKQMKKRAPVFCGELEKEQIVAMYRMGEDMTTLSSYFCVSESTIRNWADKITIPDSIIKSDHLRTTRSKIKRLGPLEPLDFKDYSLRWALGAFISQLAYRYKLKDGESVKHELSDIHHITVRR